MKKQIKKGFTLTELVIVIVIIAILAAVLIPTYTGLVQKAKDSNDTNLVKLLNDALTTAEIEKQPATMQDAVDVLDEIGYKVPSLQAKASKNTLVWNQVTNRFYIYSNNEIDIRDASPDPSQVEYNNYKLTDSQNQYTFWVISDTVNPTFSTYYTGTDATINTSKGFDAGYTTCVTSITYTNNDSCQYVVIRSNSATTSIGIYDPNGKAVNLYGTVGKVVGTNDAHTAIDETKGAIVAPSSLHIADTAVVEYLKVTQGHVENNGTIDLVYATTTDVTFTNNGTVDHAHTTTAEGSNIKANAETLTNKSSGITFDCNSVYIESDTTVDHSSTGDAEYQGGYNPDTDKKVEEVIATAEIKNKEVQYEEDSTKVVYNLTADAYYDNLYDAIDAVPDNTPQTIVLLKDLKDRSNKNYSIDLNKTITLDLNGHELNTTATEAKASYAVVVYGNLTIKDNTDTLKNGTGTGKLSTNIKKPDQALIPGYSSNTVTLYGTLTLVSGTIENYSAILNSDGTFSYGASYCVDVGANGDTKTDSIFNMNGGRLIGQYADQAVRVCNNSSHTCYFNMTDGVIESGGFWLQQSQDASKKSFINISGGEINGMIDLCCLNASEEVVNITGDTIVNASSIRIRGVSNSHKTITAAPSGAHAQTENTYFKVSCTKFTCSEGFAVSADRWISDEATLKKLISISSSTEVSDNLKFLK